MSSLKSTVSLVGLFTLNSFAMHTGICMPKQLLIPRHDPFKKNSECPLVQHIVPQADKDNFTEVAYNSEDFSGYQVANQENLPPIDHALIEVHFAESRPPTPENLSPFEKPLFFYVENNSSHNDSPQPLILQAEYEQKAKKGLPPRNPYLYFQIPTNETKSIRIERNAPSSHLGALTCITLLLGSTQPQKLSYATFAAYSFICLKIEGHNKQCTTSFSH